MFLTSAAVSAACIQRFNSQRGLPQYAFRGALSLYAAYNPYGSRKPCGYSSAAKELSFISSRIMYASGKFGRMRASSIMASSEVMQLPANTLK